ncbi:hypothetical protein MMC11_005198 [Xylographa trunciseda]|nr:hypothetical protein [Xylographa trunciseda]
MAPQTSIPVAANVLGTIGTVFWCVQLVPQIWHNWRAKKTEGLPALMMVLWAACAVPFGVYSVVQNFNVPIQIQPQVFGTLALVTWAQILIYESKWKTWKAIVVATGVFVLLGAIEAVLIVTLKGPYDRGVEWPMLVIGIIAAVLVGAGILPPYWEMWKRRGRVIGINWIFLSMDSAGALFSLFALIAQNTFDVLGGSVYIVVIILEGGIFASHIIWLFRTRKLRKRAKLQGVNFDDLPEARIYQDKRAEMTIQSYGSCDSRPCSAAVTLAADPGQLEKELAVPKPIYNPGYLSDMSETEFPKYLESGSLDIPTWDVEKGVFSTTDGAV